MRTEPSEYKVVTARGFDGTKAWWRRRGVHAARLAGVGVFAGLIAGFVVGGIGSRVAMRIAGAVDEGPVPGMLTANESVVGKITLGGTVELILIATVFGASFGVLYVLLRRWLGGRTRWHGPLAGALLLATFGAVIIEGDNRDFRLFGATGLNIAMFAALPFLFGVVIAPTTRLLERRLPGVSDHGFKLLIAYGLVATGIVVTGMVGALLIGTIIESNGITAVVGLGLIALALLPTSRWSDDTPEPFIRRIAGPTTGYLIIAAACGVRLSYLIQSINELL